MRLPLHGGLLPGNLWTVPHYHLRCATADMCTALAELLAISLLLQQYHSFCNNTQPNHLRMLHVQPSLRSDLVVDAQVLRLSGLNGTVPHPWCIFCTGGYGAYAAQPPLRRQLLQGGGGLMLVPAPLLAPLAGTSSNLTGKSNSAACAHDHVRTGACVEQQEEHIARRQATVSPLWNHKFAAVHMVRRHIWRLRSHHNNSSRHLPGHPAARRPRRQLHLRTAEGVWQVRLLLHGGLLRGDLRAVPRRGSAGGR